MDDDLQHLLDQLDSNNVPLPKPQVKLPPANELEEQADFGAVWVDGKIDADELSDSFNGISDDVVGLDNIISIGNSSSTALSSLIDIPTPQPAQAIDFQKYFNRLDGVTDEILSACRSDRQEAQDVIQMVRGQIEEALNNSKTPSRMYIDALVKSVEVKANINMTAVKMMEANAKMLAAMKANVANVQVNNVVGGNEDLKQILDEPMTAADEF